MKQPLQERTDPTRRQLLRELLPEIVAGQSRIIDLILGEDTVHRDVLCIHRHLWQHLCPIAETVHIHRLSLQEAVIVARPMAQPPAIAIRSDARHHRQRDLIRIHHWQPRLRLQQSIRPRHEIIPAHDLHRLHTVFRPRDATWHRYELSHLPGCLDDLPRRRLVLCIHVAENRIHLLKNRIAEKTRRDLRVCLRTVLRCQGFLFFADQCPRLILRHILSIHILSLSFESIDPVWYAHGIASPAFPLRCRVLM